MKAFLDVDRATRETMCWFLENVGNIVDGFLHTGVVPDNSCRTSGCSSARWTDTGWSWAS